MNTRSESGNKNQKKRHLSRELTTRLIFVVAVIFVISALLSYGFQSHRTKVLHEEKSVEYINYLRESLELPVWKMDNDTVRMICFSFSKNDVVALLRVTDENGVKLFDDSSEDESDLIMKSAVLTHDNKPLGLVEVGLTHRAYKEANNRLLIVSIFTMFVVILGVAVATEVVLHKLLKKPLSLLIARIRGIGAGEYEEEELLSRSQEISDILGEFNSMADQVKSREASLKTANQQLMASEQQLKASYQQLLANEAEREGLVKTLKYKNKELQDIVYTASHDLKSPLVNLSGFSGHLAMSCEELRKLIDRIDDPSSLAKIKDSVTNEIPESLGFIISSVTKMNSLIDGLLRISRIGTTEINIVDVDMNVLLEEVRGSMEFQLQENVGKFNVGDMPACKGDWELLNQVFTNLIDNAIKYRDSSRETVIEVSGWVDGGQAVYCVKDNGIGIEEAFQGKVFEIFHRLDPEAGVAGEGLGLTIVIRIVDRLGGRIWLESESGVGCEFFVALPSR